MPWWRILAHSLQAPLSNHQLPPQLVSFCICIRSTQWPSRSASSSPPGLIPWTLLQINYSSANVHNAHRVQLNGLLALFYLDAGATEISGVGALHPAGPRVHFNHVLWLWEDGMCPQGIEVNTVKGAPLLTGHTYRHPSTCRPLCHTSQQPADGFILSPALSPLLFYVTFLPASCLHLSSICYVLLSVSCSFGVVSHSCLTFSRQWYSGCFIGIFDNQGRECSLFF